MAIITFTNNNNPNPAIEDVLDPTGTITAQTTTTFEITNNTGGPWDGFVFRLTGTNFSYNGSTPNGGTITGITILDALGQDVATVAGPFGSTHFGSFWGNLQSGGGGLRALDDLIYRADTITGSDGDDRLTTYGYYDADTLLGGDGDDVLRLRNSNNHTAIGGAGDDTIRIDTGNHTVHGSAQDGTGGEDETDTLEIRGAASFATITHIDALSFVDPSSNSNKYVYFGAAQIGTGLLSLTLAVEGSGTNSSDQISIYRSGDAAVDLDLSAWTFTNWDRANQSIYFELSGDFQTPRDDRVVGTSRKDTISTGNGDDQIAGGNGADTLLGEAGNDVFRYLHGDDAEAGERIEGGAGTDTVSVAADSDFTDVTFRDVERLVFDGASLITFNHSAPTTATIVGDASANEVRIVLTSASTFFKNWTFESWTAVVDTLSVTGSSGDDYIGLMPVAGTYDGGGGIDTLQIERPDTTLSWTLDLSDASVTRTLADGSTIRGFESAYASFGSGNDRVVTGDDVNAWAIIVFGGGADTLAGGASRDDADGGAGNDVLDGGAGRDWLYGGDDDDQLFSRLGNTGSRDYLDGGHGVDFAFVNRSDTLRSLTLDIGDPNFDSQLADGTIIVNIERIEFRSGAGNDNLTGGALADILLGGAGRDLISGEGGDDTIRGDAGLDILSGRAGDDNMTGGAGIDFIDGDEGDDTLDGGSEADTIDGGAGNDTVIGGTGADTLGGGTGNDDISGNAGLDTIDGDAGNDVIDAGSEADTVDGGAGNDTILGAAGNDNLDGGIGNDQLDGGAGNDVIDGEAGNDTIVGGAGYDILTGGAGRDNFLFNAALVANRDVITDFTVAHDRITFDDAIFTQLATGQLKSAAFVIGDRAADSADRIVYNKETGWLLYDADGSGAGAAVRIAELDAGLALKHTNFFVV